MRRKNRSIEEEKGPLEPKRQRRRARPSSEASEGGRPPASAAKRDRRASPLRKPSPRRTIALVLLAGLFLVVIGFASNALLAPRAEDLRIEENPPAEQAGGVVAYIGGDDAGELIGLDDMQAIGSLVGSEEAEPFASTVITHAIAEGFQIDSDQSGIVRDSLREEQGGNVIRGSVRVAGTNGNVLGTFSFAFDKQESDLTFSSDEPLA